MSTHSTNVFSEFNHIVITEIYDFTLHHFYMNYKLADVGKLYS